MLCSRLTKPFLRSRLLYLVNPISTFSVLSKLGDLRFSISSTFWIITKPQPSDFRDEFLDLFDLSDLLRLHEDERPPDLDLIDYRNVSPFPAPPELTACSCTRTSRLESGRLISSEPTVMVLTPFPFLVRLYLSRVCWWWFLLNDWNEWSSSMTLGDFILNVESIGNCCYK